MTVKLKRDVIYRGRVYKVGEPIQASPDMIEVWKKNGLVVAQPPAEPAQAVGLSADAPPGLVEGGSGAEGEMPGRDSRKKGK